MSKIRIEGYDGDFAAAYKSLIESGTVPNWNEDTGYFQHETDSQTFAGWLHAEGDNSFEVVKESKSDPNLTKAQRGALIGRFIEMVVSHFSGKFSSIVVE